MWFVLPYQDLPRYIEQERRGLTQVLTLGIDSRNMKVRRKL